MRARADVERDATLPVRGLELVDPQPGVSVGAAVADLQHMDGVVYAEPDRVVRQTAIPNDPLFSYEWDMTAIRAPEAWDVTTGSAQVPVAVVDTGIDATHPDLAANVWTNPGEIRRRARDQRPRRRRQRPHRRRPRLGLRRPRRTAPRRQWARHPRLGHDRRARQRRDGVPGSTGPRRSCPCACSATTAAATCRTSSTAYVYAARSGARVVNASLGGDSYSRAEHDAIAAAPNTLFVVAAGNDGADDDATPEYPCDYDLANVVCVAASDRDDALASFSNYGATQRRPRGARRRHRQHVAGWGLCASRRHLDGVPPRHRRRGAAAGARRRADGRGPARRAAEQRRPGAGAGGPRRHRRAPRRRRCALGRPRAARASRRAPRWRPFPPSWSPAPPRPRPTTPRRRLAAHRPRHPAHRPHPRPAPRPGHVGGLSARSVDVRGRHRHRRAACTCPRARSGARSVRLAAAGTGAITVRISAPAARCHHATRACASSLARSRWMPRAIAVGPSARRRCGAERPRAAGPLANVLPSPGPRRSGICNALAHSVGIGATRATRSGGNRTCQSPRCSRSAGATQRIDRLDRLLRPT